jgi:YrbI family 3-deoxy-D-manno-octulosonate 8-phosphate phosphatase
MNIAFVPVRCGSVSIERKNIKSFCGKPLVLWCLTALQDCHKIDKIFAATDCDEIENVINSQHLEKVSIYRRTNENATSTSSSESVILEFLSKAELSSNDNFILVQATNPFVQPDDFSAALSMKYENAYDSVLSCCRIKRFFWNEDGTSKNYDFKKRPLRQEFKGDLVENGAFYINSVGNIRKYRNRLSGKIGIYEMTKHSFTEIDEPEDWIVAEIVFKRYFQLPSFKRRIKLLLTDVDGVLTDAGMYYTENGDEIKKFCTYDGVGIKLLQKAGVKTGIITSENRALNSKRAQKLRIDFVFQGVQDKLAILNQICAKEKISREEVAFIGDDINDISILQNVGLAACPSTARPEIKSINGIIVLQTQGGHGVIRELVDNYIKL